DRVADDRHVVEAEPVEQGDVEPGELGDRAEPVRAAGAAEAGVDRGDHVGATLRGQQLGKPGDGQRTAAAVQDEEWVALAEFGVGDGRRRTGDVKVVDLHHAVL